MGSSQNCFQVGEDGEVEIAEILGAVVDFGAHHGLQRFGIKRGRARRQEALFFDVHGVEFQNSKGHRRSRRYK